MKLLLPREHGAWGILLVPFFTATAIAGVFDPAVALALLVVLLAFLARYPLELVLLPARDPFRPHLSRPAAWRWAAIYAAGVLLAGGVLLAFWQLTELLALGALAAALFYLHVREARRGATRGWVAESLGTLALTLSALVAWVAATGELERTGLLIWLLNAAFFSAGLVYVKSRIRALARSAAAAPSASRLVVGFHLAVVLFVAALVLLRWASPLIILPFVLATARAGWGVRHFGQRFAVRRLGLSEVAHSLVFAALLVVAFRL